MKRKNLLLLIIVSLPLVAFTQNTRKSVNSSKSKPSRSTTTKSSANRTTSRVSQPTASRKVKNTATVSRTTTNRGTTHREKNNRNTHGHHTSRPSSKLTTVSTNTNRNVNRGTSGTTVTRTTTNVNTSRPVYSRNHSTTYSSNRNYKHYYPTTRIHRSHTVHVSSPKPVSYRKTYHPYRKPAYRTAYWTKPMYVEYCKIYPEVKYWRYDYGTRIYTISAYDAYYHIGELRRVYGKVHEVFYAKKTDEYYLYFGSYYPYHDFSIVVPGHIARSYSYRPAWYFQNQHIMVTGLVTAYKESPEIVVRRVNQIKIY